MTELPKVFRHPRDMAAAAAQVRAEGQRIGFVPTMGALHEGHLSLVEHARAVTDFVVVSIFVNPLQFNQAADLEHYPRTFMRDVELLNRHQVDAVYAPEPGDMYPPGFQTTVSLGQVTATMEGPFRPGHFDGVATVVLKLCNVVQPHLALFGEKDYQQLKVIERMVTDLDLPVTVEGRPTVREPDGLALSSRNVRLSAPEREKALCLWRAISAARGLAAAGETEVAALKAAGLAQVAAVPEARLDYLEIFDAATLEPLTVLDRPARLALALTLGQTRLIDNDRIN
ncbi:MAG: pantoate--beta-alanine ligase [Deltaproteobacteria bacterium]|nr:pantoate--beta-alanine ligase [Deltaproteobacteria bacterium]